MSNNPTIVSLATGVPEGRYRQEEIFEYMQLYFKRGRHARAIFTASGVDYRHTAIDLDFYRQERSTQFRNETYLQHAIPLGEATIRRCLEGAGLEPQEIHDFFVVSCTGYDIPGLDLQLAGRLCMSPHLQRTCILGMGCYGAFPGLLRARQAVAGHPGRTALVLALELCSLHMQFDDSLENMVVNSLFADGAAAAIVRQEPDKKVNSGSIPRPHLVDSATFCDYQTFDHMAFHLGNNGFQMRLSAYVPQVLAANVEVFIDQMLVRNGLRREEIRHWGIHPGGRKILDSIQERLGLGEDDLAPARQVLRDYGNMSSPTILFVLDEIMQTRQPEPGDYGVLMAFGPGLTMEAALLYWE
jgi:predicted naringenin-chalcone synthase